MHFIIIPSEQQELTLERERIIRHEQLIHKDYNVLEPLYSKLICNHG